MYSVHATKFVNYGAGANFKQALYSQKICIVFLRFYAPFIHDWGFGGADKVRLYWSVCALLARMPLLTTTNGDWGRPRTWNLGSLTRLLDHSTTAKMFIASQRKINEGLTDKVKEDTENVSKKKRTLLK